MTIWVSVTNWVIVIIWVMEGFRIERTDFSIRIELFVYNFLKKLVLKRIQCIFPRNPSHTQIVTFSLGQKGFGYFGRCHYLGCDYYEWEL